MKKLLALMAGIGLVWAASDNARAQSASSDVFNPFASFSLNRFTFNTLGFLQVGPLNPFAITSSTPSAGAEEAGEDELPQPVVVRPPFRPPVRSPYRPPPRPPF